MEPRIATPADLPAIDALLARSYPALLKADYPPSVLVTALPLISRAQPALLASGTHWVTTDGSRAVACGGWTAAPPRGRTAPRGWGSVRHLAVDPARTRRGLARALMEAALGQARGAGVRAMQCLSTRTAVPFYASLGFEVVGPVDVALRNGIVFPSIEMRARL
ncbi:GNAT family N-acetyltransferase [Jannaschia sp. LMIT008]|uniref:GNAT family N-acetyltransferase n=1 Tax=Jannaschia maritima TaxID=3032585 RepID=UPI002811439C|nr:GNAT family N-acetyltransferase [Jannaschia sp. LMIT008]